MAEQERKEDLTGILTEIHRSSFHDGPGVRTVFFFKGCPLHCAWCHNPESLNFIPEIRRRKDPSWPNKILEELVGKSFTVKELVREAEKDRAWYESTGGGITLSGGEALAQGEFTLELLKELGERRIHRAVETSGAVNGEILNESLNVTDLYLFDWKCSDREDLKKWTGASLDQVTESLELILSRDKPVHLRLPLIPGVNDNDNQWETIARWAQFDQIKKVEIMAYHNWGRDRYLEVGRPLPPEFPTPSKEMISSWKEVLAEKIKLHKLIPKYMKNG
jgi:pyruvate formate lyase activating enzyme